MHRRPTGIPTRLLAAIALLLAPAAALAAGNEPPDWDRLARELNNPTTTLGLAADIGTLFAGAFYDLLFPVWRTIALIAVMATAIMWVTGGLRGDHLRTTGYMFLAGAIFVFGMYPVDHKTYLTDNPATLFYAKPDKTEDAAPTDTSGERQPQSPALLEYATYVGIWGHRLIGSAIDEVFSGEAKVRGSDKIAVAHAAQRAINDGAAARQLQGADGNLPRAYLTYQRACGNVLNREAEKDPEFSISAKMRVALALDGAAMIPPPPGSNAKSAIDGLTRGEWKTIERKLKQYTPAFTGERDPEGVPTSSRGVETTVHSYPAYQIPKAEYWSRRYGSGGENDESEDGEGFNASDPGSRFINAVQHFGGADGGKPTLSYQQFPQGDFRAIVGANTPFVGENADEEVIQYYFIPKNCWELYQVNRIGFAALWLGYSDHFVVENMGRTHPDAMCFAQEAGRLIQGGMFQAWGLGTQMQHFLPSWISGHMSGGSCLRKAASSAGIMNSTSLALHRGEHAMMRDPVMGPDGQDTYQERVLDDIRAEYNELKDKLGALFQYFDLERNVPLLMGGLALAYAATLTFFPLVAAFSMLPGRIGLLALPLKILLFIHVALVINYALLRAGAWIYGALVNVVSSGMSHAALFQTPYSKLLVGLPVMLTFISGLGMGLAGWLIFSERFSSIPKNGQQPPPGANEQKTSSGQTVYAATMIASRAAGAGRLLSKETKPPKNTDKTPKPDSSPGGGNQTNAGSTHPMAQNAPSPAQTPSGRGHEQQSQANGQKQASRMLQQDRERNGGNG